MNVAREGGDVRSTPRIYAIPGHALLLQVSLGHPYAEVSGEFDVTGPENRTPEPR